MPSEKVSIAVVTGDHPFRERDFDALFESMGGIDFVREDLSVFVNDPKRKQYQTIVFYNFHQQNPAPETAEAVLELADNGQGLVILHHAILAFPQWDEFASICGIEDHKFGYFVGERIRIHVADTQHPITAGMSDWDMIDETYTMKSPAADSHILLTAEHPKSMKVIGWLREYRNSRVFCLQSGHDNRTYSVPQFREVLERGIRWVAKR